MSNIVLLKKQHEEILGVMSQLDTLIKKGDLDNTAKDIAFSINALAGKLKMHLMSEDQYLYPTLMNSADMNLKTTSQSFYAEMGQLAAVFTKFVQDYNVPGKITSSKAAFLNDIRGIATAVKNRISKEESKLYPLIDK